jgi:Ser/Thr protein kinase RdoA (MazF antagonist)
MKEGLIMESYSTTTNINSGDNFEERLPINTNIDDISKCICTSYKLGNYISSDLITIGYEDYNYILTTSKDKYCIKIMSKQRTSNDIKNYIERINAVAESDIQTPKPLKINDNALFHLTTQNNNYDIIVFEYINGHNFYSMGINPTEEELITLTEEILKIHSINIKPEFIYDSWAITNFENEFNHKNQYLSEEEKTELAEILEKFKLLDFKKLPYAFTHADIINTNLMRDKNNKLWIIDWAVSNYIPRIIDLVIVACNLCLDKESEENTRKRVQLVISEYEKQNPLTSYEKECFEILYKVANAMHILQTKFITATVGTSSENDYWYNEGKIGLSYNNLLQKSKTL